MAADFPKVSLKRFPPLEDKETQEARFWKRFRKPVTIPQIGTVNHVCFNPLAPHDLAVTTSARIVVYNGQNLSERHKFTRFKDIARCGEFRNDGKLLVGGSDSGPIHLHNSSTKAMLRVFRGHKGPVHATKFSGKTNILSGGDDATVKVWDVSQESEITSFAKHTDYVRALACSEVSSSIFASGSYDHTVQLWDSRSGSARNAAATMALNHGAPVSALLMLRGNGTLVSAGSNYLKVWDIVSGGKLLATLSNHQKQITALSLDGTHERMLSGGLDGHVKFYDLSTYEVAYGFKHSSPILSLAVNSNNTKLAIGCTDNTLTVKQRVVPTKQVAAEKRQAEVLRGGSYKYFMRGQSRSPSIKDVTVETDKAPKLTKYEKYLKKFQFNEALTAALATSNPIIILSMFEELTRRGGLRAAIANRDEVNLEPLVSFVVRYITHPRYSSVLLDVANMILDTYAPVMGQSYSIDHWFVKLQHKLKEELKIQHQLFHLQGALDAIVAGSTGCTMPDEEQRSNHEGEEYNDVNAEQESSDEEEKPTEDEKQQEQQPTVTEFPEETPNKQSYNSDEIELNGSDSIMRKSSSKKKRKKERSPSAVQEEQHVHGYSGDYMTPSKEYREKDVELSTKKSKKKKSTGKKKSKRQKLSPES